MREISEDFKSIVYIGPSMYPTLKNMDRLLYKPYINREIRAGDIVVINRIGNSKVIHRVLSADNRGLITIGDNNSKPDSWTLRPDQIGGQIFYAIRDGKRLRIRGGLMGRIHATWIKSFCYFFQTACRIFKHPYNIIAGTVVLRPIPIKPKLLVFRHADGTELQLVIGRYIIGRRKPGSNWQIRPPFLLFLDKNKLPSEVNYKYT